MAAQAVELPDILEPCERFPLLEDRKARGRDEVIAILRQHHVLHTIGGWTIGAWDPMVGGEVADVRWRYTAPDGPGVRIHVSVRIEGDEGTTLRIVRRIDGDVESLPTSKVFDARREQEEARKRDAWKVSLGLG